MFLDLRMRARPTRDPAFDRGRSYRRCRALPGHVARVPLIRAGTAVATATLVP
jgi:hypothetical protein